MQQAAPPRFVLDPDDPRAPPQADWDAMTEDERRAVVESLPAEVPLELHPPEGDRHHDAKEAALDALRRYFRSIHRRIYVTSELATYYPAQPRFCPDLLAVLEVDDHPRDSWMVSREGRGLDLALEVYWKGDERKDFTLNVERYARLGIGEYFVLDLRRERLLGYRLPPGGGEYQPLVPQHGRWGSQVLGLDLSLEQGGVRFYAGTAPLPGADELLHRVQAMLDEVIQKRLAAEARLADAEARAAGAEQRVAALSAELERLRAELAGPRKS